MEIVETETTRKLAKVAKCAHEECVCTVSSGEEFCSDYCAQAAGDETAGGGDCKCGHPECKGASAATFAPYGGGTS